MSEEKNQQGNVTHFKTKFSKITLQEIYGGWYGDLLLKSWEGRK